MGLQWPAGRAERGTVVVLGVALVGLGFLIAGSAKEICGKGQVMWEGQAVTGVGQVPLLLRILCDPKDGPFRAHYAPAPMPGQTDHQPVWSILEDRFRHVDDAREALEAFVAEA